MRIDKKTIGFEYREGLGCDVLRLSMIVSDRTKTHETKHMAVEVVVEPFSGVPSGEIVGLAGALDRMASELRKSEAKGKFNFGFLKKALK